MSGIVLIQGASQIVKTQSFKLILFIVLSISIAVTIQTIMVYVDQYQTPEQRKKLSEDIKTQKYNTFLHFENLADFVVGVMLVMYIITVTTCGNLRFDSKNLTAPSVTIILMIILSIIYLIYSLNMSNNKNKLRLIYGTAIAKLIYLSVMGVVLLMSFGIIVNVNKFNKVIEFPTFDNYTPELKNIKPYKNMSYLVIWALSFIVSVFKVMMSNRLLKESTSESTSESFSNKGFFQTALSNIQGAFAGNDDKETFAQEDSSGYYNDDGEWVDEDEDENGYGYEYFSQNKNKKNMKSNFTNKKNTKSNFTNKKNTKSNFTNKKNTKSNFSTTPDCANPLACPKKTETFSPIKASCPTETFSSSICSNPLACPDKQKNSSFNSSTGIGNIDKRKEETFKNNKRNTTSNFQTTRLAPARFEGFNNVENYSKFNNSKFSNTKNKNNVSTYTIGELTDSAPNVSYDLRGGEDVKITAAVPAALNTQVVT